MRTGSSKEEFQGQSGPTVSWRESGRALPEHGRHGLFSFSVFCQGLAHDRARGPVILGKGRGPHSIFAVLLYLTFMCTLHTHIPPHLRFQSRPLRLCSPGGTDTFDCLPHICSPLSACIQHPVLFKALSLQWSLCDIVMCPFDRAEGDFAAPAHLDVPSEGSWPRFGDEAGSPSSPGCQGAVARLGTASLCLTLLLQFPQGLTEIVTKDTSFS
jgi:hypothetical protein